MTTENESRPRAGLMVQGFVFGSMIACSGAFILNCVLIQTSHRAIFIGTVETPGFKVSDTASIATVARADDMPAPPLKPRITSIEELPGKHRPNTVERSSPEGQRILADVETWCSEHGAKVGRKSMSECIDAVGPEMGLK